MLFYEYTYAKTFKMKLIHVVTAYTVQCPAKALITLRRSIGAMLFINND